MDTHMKTIGDLISRPLDRKIEEIIQVDQADEQSFHAEISEYVGTDSIRDQDQHLLKAVAEPPVSIGSCESSQLIATGPGQKSMVGGVVSSMVKVAMKMEIFMHSSSSV